MINKTIFKKYIKCNLIKSIKIFSVKKTKLFNKLQIFKFYWSFLYITKKKNSFVLKNFGKNRLHYKIEPKKKFKNDKYLNYIFKLEKIKKIKKIFSFNKIIKKLLKKKVTKFKFNEKNSSSHNVKKLPNFSKYQKIFNNIFYNLFKKKINVINFNYFFKTKIKKFNYIVKKVLMKNFFLKKTVYTYKIIKIFLSSLIYKDSSLIVLILKNMFEKIHYSKHRIYFNFWSFLVKAFVSNNFKKLGIFGLKLEFHGKLAVGGNSKKRSYYYSIGRCSNSSKIFKLDSSHSYFNTATGVVGFTFNIYY